jgi:hypothetical protein
MVQNIETTSHKHVRGTGTTAKTPPRWASVVPFVCGGLVSSSHTGSWPVSDDGIKDGSRTP